MLSFAVLVYFAAVISGYAAAMALLLCPWLGKGLRSRFQHLIARMPTRKYRLKRTAFIGCHNTSYMDVDDAEPCTFFGSRQVTIYPFGQGATSYVEGVRALYLSSATCRCRGCTAEIDGPQRKSIIEGEDEYNACIAALKTWNTRYIERREI